MFYLFQSHHANDYLCKCIVCKQAVPIKWTQKKPTAQTRYNKNIQHLKILRAQQLFGPIPTMKINTYAKTIIYIWGKYFCSFSTYLCSRWPLGFCRILFVIRWIKGFFFKPRIEIEWNWSWNRCMYVCFVNTLNTN